MVNMNMFGQMPGGQSTSERAMADAQAHLQSQKTAAQLAASQNTEMQATAGINPMFDPLGALAAATSQNPVARAMESDMQYNNAITPLQQDKVVGITGNNVSKALSLDHNAINRIM